MEIKIQKHIHTTATFDIYYEKEPWRQQGVSVVYFIGKEKIEERYQIKGGHYPESEKFKEMFDLDLEETFNKIQLKKLEQSLKELKRQKKELMINE